LGPEVQTLTRAMTAILCKGLEGATPQEILDLPSDFVTRIIGAELVRVRSQTTYYMLTRIKGICKVYLDRQRMAVAYRGRNTGFFQPVRPAELHSTENGEAGMCRSPGQQRVSNPWAHRPP